MMEKSKSKQIGAVLDLIAGPRPRPTPNRPQRKSLAEKARPWPWRLEAGPTGRSGRREAESHSWLLPATQRRNDNFHGPTIQSPLIPSSPTIRSRNGDAKDRRRHGRPQLSRTHFVRVASQERSRNGFEKRRQIQQCRRRRCQASLFVAIDILTLKQRGMKVVM